MIEKISVVVPSYNAAAWLPKSIPRVDDALKISGVKNAEIIIIDDGSTDNTKEVINTIKTKFPLRFYVFENGGRFLARKRGINKAKYEDILLIDTRIYIEPKGLKFIIDTQKKDPERRVWTSHVHLDKEGNMYAGFWEAITFVAWRKYFTNPRDVSYGINEFDDYPKGTTCFFAPKKALTEANVWFEKNTKDMSTSNDDTLLIRRIAAENSININPQFSCEYHARTNIKQFIRHVYHRGKVFVDGFLRRDGNKLFFPLIAFLVVSATTPVILVFNPEWVQFFALAFIFSWVSSGLVLALVGVGRKDTRSFLVLSPLFLLVYGAGIWHAFIKINVKYRLFKN